MALLDVTELDADGLVPALAAATAGAGDEAPVGPGHFLMVRNSSGGSITATFRVPVAVGAIRQHAVAIAAGATHLHPIPQRGALGQGSAITRDADANATVTYSAVASVTVGAFRAP